MKVVVTGGSGYIGSVVTRKLTERGDIVTNVDIKNGCDIRDRGYIRQVISDARPDAVIHLAALSIVSESVKWPLDYYMVNVGGTLNLLEAMEYAGVDKMVFASSAAVYGDMPPVPVTEEYRLEPVNTYGRTKVIGEHMIGYCVKNATCLRFFNVAGGDERHEPETHLIPNILKAKRNGEPVAIYGCDYPTHDGTCIRDYVHVEDIADAHLLALDKLDGFRVFNLANGRGYSCLEVVVAAGAAYQMHPRRSGDVPVMIADYARAVKQLGWNPQRTLTEMVR